MPLTEKEIQVFEQTADLWNSFGNLPVLHPDDLNDFKFHLHGIQNIILSRSAFREINKPEIVDIKQKEVLGDPDPVFYSYQHFTDYYGF